MILLNLLFIQLICVLVIDISGFIDSVKYGISYILTKGKFPKTEFRIKPIDCSLCMTFWTGLIYIICMGQFSLPYLAYILALAVMTPIVKDVIVLLKDICIYVINKIYDILK